MIQNDLQYRVTQREAGRFREVLALRVKGKGKDPRMDLFIELEAEAIRSVLADLDHDLAAYEHARPRR